MSRLSDYFAALDSVAPGWNKSNWEKALSDTRSCTAGLSATDSAVNRMKAFITCRRGKKVLAT